MVKRSQSLRRTSTDLGLAGARDLISTMRVSLHHTHRLAGVLSFKPTSTLHTTTLDFENLTAWFSRKRVVSSEVTLERVESTAVTVSPLPHKKHNTMLVSMDTNSFLSSRGLNRFPDERNAVNHVWHGFSSVEVMERARNLYTTSKGY